MPMRRLKNASGGGAKLQRASNRGRGPFHSSNKHRNAAAAGQQRNDADDGSIGSTLSLRDQFDIIVPIKIKRGNRDMSQADSDVSSITADDRKKFYFVKGQSPGSPYLCCCGAGGGESTRTAGNETTALNTVLANASIYTGMAQRKTQQPRLTSGGADEKRDDPADEEAAAQSSLWVCCEGLDSWCSAPNSSMTNNTSNSIHTGAKSSTLQSTSGGEGGATSPQSSLQQVNSATAAAATTKQKRPRAGRDGTGGNDTGDVSTSKYSLFDALSSEEQGEWFGDHDKSAKRGGATSNHVAGTAVLPGSINWRTSIRKALPWSRKGGGKNNGNSSGAVRLHQQEQQQQQQQQQPEQQEQFVAEERQDT